MHVSRQEFAEGKTKTDEKVFIWQTETLVQVY